MLWSGPSEAGALPTTAAGSPLVGFSFSPWAVSWASGQTPRSGLTLLLDRLHPDLVRLPVYWSEVAAEPDRFDFVSLDGLVDTVRAYNRALPISARPVRLLLVVGGRNLVYPELRVPGWVSAADQKNLRDLYSRKPYRDYLAASFKHFAGLPELYGWQIENEPLDDVTTDRSSSVALPALTVDSELLLLRSIDGRHPAVITTFNSSHVSLDKKAAGPLGWLYRMLPGPRPAGHPLEALQLGNALGLDVYVVTPSTPLQEDPAWERIAWKAQALDYWSARAKAAGKALWITEMQAAPWSAAAGFTTQDLEDSARSYRGKAGVIMLWGVERWLYDGAWMEAGARAISTLRSSGGG